MQKKPFNFTSNSKKFRNFSISREKLVSMRHSVKGRVSLSELPYSSTYNSIKSFFNYRVTFWKQNNIKKNFSLDYKLSLYLFFEEQKGKKKLLNTGSFSLTYAFPNERGFPPIFWGQITAPRMSLEKGISNFNGIKTIRKALSPLYSIQNTWGQGCVIYNNPPGYCKSLPSPRETFAFPNERQIRDWEGKRLGREKQVFTKIFLFLKKETLKKNYQTLALIITKINQQLRKIKHQKTSISALRAIYRSKCGQSPHFSLSKHSLEREKLFSGQGLHNKNNLCFPNHRLGKDRPPTPLGGLLGQITGGLTPIKRELNGFPFPIDKSIDKSIKNLIWIMLKKQYSNISKSLIANKNWFFLVVKNYLLNRQESYSFKYQKSYNFKSRGLSKVAPIIAPTYTFRSFALKGKQMSSFFSLSLLPFIKRGMSMAGAKPLPLSFLSLKTEKSSLVQLDKFFFFWSKSNIIWKKNEPYVLLNSFFELGFAPPIGTRFFNRFFKFILLSPTQCSSPFSSPPPWGGDEKGDESSFKMTVKSGEKSNKIDLGFFLFLKINLYNTYTFMYTSDEFKTLSRGYPLEFIRERHNLGALPLSLEKGKKETSFPSGKQEFKNITKTRQQHQTADSCDILRNFQIPMHPKESKNRISKYYLFGMTHYLDCSKRKQSRLKMSYLFQTFSISSRGFKKVSGGIALNKKENYNISIDKFKKVFILYPKTCNKLKYSKKQKLFSIWKNQIQVTSFCNYSF